MSEQDTVRKYRKKPVVIEAMRVDGDQDGHIMRTVARWCGGRAAGAPTEPHIYIDTLEGTMRADYRDYIIRGVQGEFYPCKPDIFEATYEPTEEADYDEREYASALADSLADVAIYLLGLAEMVGVDLQSEIENKIFKNADRRYVRQDGVLTKVEAFIDDVSWSV